MRARPTSPPPERPRQAPEILLKIGETAGWDYSDLLNAVSQNIRSRGIFNSVTADLPCGLKALPELPVIDVRRASSDLSVEVRFELEHISCGGQGLARLAYEGIFRESFIARSIGLPIGNLVGHPLLESPSFIIQKFYEPLRVGQTIIVFAMPNCDFPD